MGEEREGLEGDDASALSIELSARLLAREMSSEGVDTHSHDLAGCISATVSLLDELLRSRLATILNTEDVDCEHALEVFFGQLQQAFDLGDACVGDECVQRSEVVDGFLDHLLDFGKFGDIGEDDGGFAAESLDFFGGLFGDVLVRLDVVYRYVVAVGGELEGDGFADTAGGTCYDCYSTGVDVRRGGEGRADGGPTPY